MNVLLIFPSLTSHSEAIYAWRSQLVPQDRLSIMTLSWSAPRQLLYGVNVHSLDIDLNKRRYWRLILLWALRHWPNLVRPLRNVILWRFWSDFLWNVRSFDPDVVDLRWMPVGMALKAKLAAKLNRIHILSEKHSPLPEAVCTSWRSYDPALKVSIVLPVYNGAKYLSQSIESCLQQNHKNIELVIVDDCSADETPHIIAQYAGQDSRIINIRNKHNLHLPGALNVGFAHACGDLLTWTSHDNYYAPKAIETLVRYLCTWQDVDFVYSAYHIIDSEGRVNSKVNYLPPPWQLPLQNTVGAYFLYRRVVYDIVGEYHENMEYLEDYEYWVRVYKKGFKMMRLHLPLYYYRHHSEAMTAQASKMGNDLWGKVRRQYFS